MRTILIDAINTFISKDEKGCSIFKAMHELLEQYPNRKIIVTNADDAQMREFGLDNMPYAVFTMKHTPDKVNPLYFKTLLKQFHLHTQDVIYIEHNSDAVKSARSIGIAAFHYDKETRDISAVKQFIDAHL